MEAQLDFGLAAQGSRLLALSSLLLALACTGPTVEKRLMCVYEGLGGRLHVEVYKYCM